MVLTAAWQHFIKYVNISAIIKSTDLSHILFGDCSGKWDCQYNYLMVIVNY